MGKSKKRKLSSAPTGAHELAVHQYDVLMAAISRQQEARSVVLAGALLLIGTVVVSGWVSVETSGLGNRHLVLTLLLVFGHVLVLVSVLLTGYYTRGVHRLSARVRYSIEEAVGGISIESEIDLERKSAGRTRKSKMGASSTFAAIYSTLVVFLGASGLASGLWEHAVTLAITCVATLATLLVSIDLSLRFLPIWYSNP
jgi:uncharacterized membrane protein YgdD (TMEM256/DUF423 family)